MQDLPPVPARPSHIVGPAFLLLLVPTGSTAAFGPAWAVLCGACAAASSLWQEARVSSNSPLLHAVQTGRGGVIALVLTLFTAEVLWSTWRALLVGTRWAGLQSRYLPSLATADQAPAVPYATPWSPVGRLQRFWSQARRRPRRSASADTADPLPTLAILTPLILVLSALAGPAMVLLSLAAFCLTLIEWQAARHGTLHTVLQASVQIGLSWLAGHSAFGQATMPSFVLACCYAISYQGALSLDVEVSPPEARRHSWSLALFYGGQATALAVLVLLGHPFMAVLVGMLLAPQMLLLSRLEQGEHSAWFLRRALPFLMAAMPLAAWTAQP